MFKEKFFVLPLAIVTMIVSPIAREIANTNEATIPENAAGKTTFVATSSFVEPRPYEASLKLRGTAFIASSEREAIIGIIIIPIINPGLKMFVVSRPGMKFLRNGVINVKAKKP